MRFRWLLLLPSFLSVFLFSAAVQAGQLAFWRFDTNQNRLSFTTRGGGVQPKAQLISDPARVVIDLPGTTLAGPTANQRLRGGIKEIRVGQVDDRTTRIVVELEPGYTLDPKQVKFRGITASQWTVDFPRPQRVGSSPSSPPPRKPPQEERSNIQFFQSLSAQSTQPLLKSDVSQLATIQSVELANNQTQLLIRADLGVRATSTWDAIAKAYRITIPGARLADRIRGPQLNASSPVARVLLRQQDPRTVVILVQPATGTQIGELNQLTDQLLALQLQQPRSQTPPIATIPVPLPERPGSVLPPNTATPPVSLPSVRNARVVVMVDPGHGGPDPGAIGRGGLRETDIVLSIGQQVAALLQQQGLQVFVTRNSDYDVGLASRVAMAERVNADLFVSIHANAIDLSRPDINGLETYYYSSDRAFRLAQAIHVSILQNLDIPDRGIRTARFFVLRKTSMPSVLVEVGFVTGGEDSVKLSNSTYRSQMARAIARGILQYIQQYT